MKKVLAIIVISQFLCTSLWFAGNAVLPDIISNLDLDQRFLAHLTSAVQLGFISGTLVFAILSVSDRYSPSKVFLLSALVAALFNVCITINGLQAPGLLIFRFLTGFFLAGIYPVGMKIASDYYQAGLGKSLGLLVGALVVGTALPHLLKNITASFPWQYVLYATTALSILGGMIMVIFVPDGPYRKPGPQLKFTAFMQGFSNAKFRSAAFGYFGHMWELYAFWAFVPLMLLGYSNQHPGTQVNVSLYAFAIIGAGALACAVAGYLSQKISPKMIATLALFLSGLCCLLSPLFFMSSSVLLFVSFLFFWGLVVVADSPMFSTLVAQNAPETSRGTSLTIVNCIGFAITIVSIQVIMFISAYVDVRYVYMFLAIGPLLGLAALLRKE